MYISLNQESKPFEGLESVLRFSATIGFTASRETLIWNVNSGLLFYGAGPIIVLEELGEILPNGVHSMHSTYLAGHCSDVCAIALQHNRQQLASAAEPLSLVVKNTGRIGHSPSKLGLPNGPELFIWNLKTYSVAKRFDTRFLLDGEPAAIRCVRFSEDDRFLPALANVAAIDSLGEGYSEVAVWDASSHELLVCSRLVGAVHDARWDPRTSLEFATAGERGRLLFWTLESLTARSSARNGQLPESAEAPFNLMFSKPPPTAFDQSSLLARDAKSSNAPATNQNGVQEDFLCLAYSRTHPLLLAATASGLVYALNARSGQFIARCSPAGPSHYQIGCLALPFSGAELLVGCADGNVRALDLRPLLSSLFSGSEVATSGLNAADGLSARTLELPVRAALAFDSAAVVALAFDDRATVGLVASATDNLWYINTVAGDRTHLLTGIPSPLNCACLLTLPFLPSTESAETPATGNKPPNQFGCADRSGVAPEECIFVAAGGTDGAIRIWALSSPFEQVATFELSAPIPVSSICSWAAPCDKPIGEHPAVIAAGYRDGSLRLFDLCRLQMWHSLQPHASPVLNVSFAPCGTFVISNELGGSVVVINVSDGYIVRRIEDHADQLITSLCVSSDIFCFEQPIPKVSSSIRNSRNTPRPAKTAAPPSDASEARAVAAGSLFAIASVAVAAGSTGAGGAACNHLSVWRAGSGGRTSVEMLEWLQVPIAERARNPYLIGRDTQREGAPAETAQLELLLRQRRERVARSLLAQKEHVSTTCDLWHLLEAFGGGVTDILCACFITMSAANPMSSALPILMFTTRTFHLDSSSTTQLVTYDLSSRTPLRSFSLGEALIRSIIPLSYNSLALLRSDHTVQCASLSSPKSSDLPAEESDDAMQRVSTVNFPLAQSHTEAVFTLLPVPVRQTIAGASGKRSLLLSASSREMFLWQAESLQDQVPLSL